MQKGQKPQVNTKTQQQKTTTVNNPKTQKPNQKPNQQVKKPNQVNSQKPSLKPGKVDPKQVKNNQVQPTKTQNTKPVQQPNKTTIQKNDKLIKKPITKIDPKSKKPLDKQPLKQKPQKRGTDDFVQVMNMYNEMEKKAKVLCIICKKDKADKKFACKFKHSFHTTCNKEQNKKCPRCKQLIIEKFCNLTI